jgi:GNAT superfamily N-acetyltransferase
MMATEAAAAPATWQRDAFLERHLGYPVFRLRELHAVRAAIDAAGAHADWMIEARVPVGEPAQSAVLARHGFRIADTNVQLRREARAGAPVTAGIRFATPADEAAVRTLAARCFSQTRFHLDPHIPRAAADRVKEEWAANYFSGRRGEWMVVAEDAIGVCGFNQVLRAADDSLVVDLIAVAERARQRGHAAAMIEYAARVCLDRPAAVSIGTQIANFGSLSVYTRLGFRPTTATYVFHLHRADLIP